MIKRFLIVILIPICLLAGCTRVTEEQRKLIGKWQIADAESVSERVSSDESTTMSARMSVEFQSSGQFITQTKMGNIDSTKQGTWKIASYDPTENVMKIECVLQMQKTECEIEFLDKDEIKWVPPNMAGTTQKIRFRRIN